VGGRVLAIGVQLALSIAVFVIAYRRNRLYFHRSTLGAIGIALAAAVICPLGVLLFYAVSGSHDRRT
jgi:hypothetical protein